MTDLRTTVRECIANLDRGGVNSAPAIVEPIRKALAERGLGPDCHVGVVGMGPDRALEWYAGQILSVVDQEAWYAVNSLINTVDRFAGPAEVCS